MAWKNGMTSAVRSAAARAGALGRPGHRRERPAWGGDGQPGPPNGFALLPWLLTGLGSVSSLVQGTTPMPWIAGLGLAVFTALYAVVVFRAFDKAKREARCTRWMLAVMAVAAFALAAGYGGNWLVYIPLLALASGAVLRGRAAGQVIFGCTVVAGVISGTRIGWDALGYAYGTFISGMVTAAIMALSETVKELRATREELARTAVERERLRFSRDLHDLLGHTLSVVVVKAGAARRLAPRNVDAALAHVTDIESVGRQALTEIREAVTGYREGSLSTEMDRARSALTAAGVEPVVGMSGPPLTAQQEALLGWVVREAVTNVIRHSGADRCEITVARSGKRMRLEIADDGRGPTASVPKTEAGARAVGGTGLKGLTERLAAVGGLLTAGRGPRGGFLVTAELPLEPVPGPAPAAGRDPGAGVILEA